MSNIEWKGHIFNEAFEFVELYPDQLHHIRKVLLEMENISQRIAAVGGKATGNEKL